MTQDEIQGVLNALCNVIENAPCSHVVGATGCIAYQLTFVIYPGRPSDVNEMLRQSFMEACGFTWEESDSDPNDKVHYQKYHYDPTTKQ